MKKFMIGMVAVSATLALTACSSSDDSVKAGASTMIQPKNADSKNNPTAVPQDKQVATGQHWQLAHTEKSSTIEFHNMTGIAPDNLDVLNKLVVDGKTLDLTNVHEEGLTPLHQAGLGGQVGSTGHSKFGIVGYKDKGIEKDYVFYQGLQTAPNKMPTEGKMSYTGFALHDCEECRERQAVSKFDVDFGAKTVKGEIGGSKYITGGKVALEADIKGSAFSGFANGVQTNGAFYGVDASEMSGVYKSANFAGAFGATKVAEPIKPE
ncbi:transferrin-binding protein-like solute binding protein [Moraxella sp. VT-16-12]|uniref:transferrin-binding protein-like solute binding protein n=1 Tax=Moraxella sp. VT-16-12 TaxID=2014877 RepID=UPI000B7E1521|nr:transferrin-binding protein-like solute binding protein [Moraxella sp. VT-16-12]TWV81258.1 transferrin-binding protein-like solute binding protein [Moraxella sp. VT-16-12]